MNDQGPSVDDSNQQWLQYMSRLQFAHNSSILMYIRDSKSMELAKQFRPEFAKIYYAYELKDAIRIISKLNLNITDEPIHQHGIDLVIADSDHTTMKLLEAIQRHNYPAVGLIPAIIILLSESLDLDIKTDLINPSISSGFIAAPFTASHVFDTILEVLHRKSIVDSAVVELRHKESRRPKYPFIPLFEEVESPEKEKERKEAVIKEKRIRDGDDEDGINEEVEDFMTEVSEWVESPNLLPKILQDLRTRHSAAEQHCHNAPARTVEREMRYRKRLDKKVVSDLKTDCPTDDAVSSGSDEEDGLLSVSSKRMAYNSKSSRSIKVTLERSTESSQSASGATNLDMLAFIDRSPPDVTEKRTVVGLNRKVAERCWRAIDGKSKTNAGSSNAPRLSMLSSPSFCPSPIGVPSTAPSRRAMTAEAKFHAPFPAKRPGTSGGRGGLSPLTCPELVRPKTTSAVVESASSIELTANPFSSGPQLFMESRLELAIPFETSDMPSSSSGSVTQIASVNKARQQAMRTMRRLAADAPKEVSVHKLMQLDMSIRKISAGEWQPLERGLMHQRNDDLHAAAETFRSALKRSRQPQLPMLMLGNCYYAQANYLAALKQFNDVIELLYGLHGPKYNVRDDFIAHYNRAMVHFCLGGDEKGLEDLRACLALDGIDKASRLEVHTVLATALRRLGRYSDAIAQTTAGRKLAPEPDSENNKQYQQPGPLEMGSITTAPTQLHSLSQVHTLDGVGASTAEGSHHHLAGESTTSHRVVAEIGIRNFDAMSIRGRKNDQIKNRAMKDSSEQMGNQLETFKLKNGINRSLFETLFVRMSPIQEALTCRGTDRTADQLGLIGEVLMSFEFMRGASPETVAELSRLVTYNPVSSKGDLFPQDRTIDSCCFVLSGEVLVRQDMTALPNPTKAVPVGSMVPGDVFGFIDMLFSGDPEKTNIKRFLKDEDSQTLSHVATQNQSFRLKPDDAALSRADSIFPRKNVPRALQPGCLMSYLVLTPTELIQLEAQHFYRLLVPIAAQVLEDRLDVLRSCGVFSGFSRTDLLRLVRMLTVRKYREGEVVLKQQAVPSSLYLLSRGLCRVTKRPTQLGNVLSKLNELRDRAKEFDTTYIFHHSMRSKGASLSSAVAATSSEMARKAIDSEIALLQSQLSKAAAMDEKEESMPGFNAADRECEIQVIKRPQIFGEASVLEPDKGVSLGSIVADTACEVLVIHQAQLQTFHIGDVMLERVRQRAIVYPSDDQALERRARTKVWQQFKTGLIKDMFTTGAVRVRGTPVNS